MKTFIMFVLVLFMSNCKNPSNRISKSEADMEFIGHSYRNYLEIPYLKDYVKVSDTSFTARESPQQYESTHRLTALKEDQNFLILFNKIISDPYDQEVVLILDTLRINNLEEDLFITIGYCEGESLLMEQTIAVAQKTTNDTLQKILLAWKADTATQKIVKMENPETLVCFNEF